MKRIGKTTIWLAGGLVLSAVMLADNVALADNPYAPIVTRNIFGLNAASVEEPPGDPPPKITLNGIMSISGHLQVLFKVAGNGKSGQSGKDQSYILSEGQRQDDIEVMHIDTSNKTNLVTFNNHGTVQNIPMASSPAAGGASGPGQGGAPGSRAVISKPTGGANGSMNANVIGNSSGHAGASRPNSGMGNQNPNPNPPASPMEGGINLQSVPTRAGNSGQQAQNTQAPVSPEQQVINMEIQRSLWKSQGNPAYKIIPPTVISPHNETPAE